MRFFSFTIPLLNRIFVLGASSIPWLALKPFSRLSKWDRQWWGCLLLYPLLCMTLVTFFNQACSQRANQALVKDLASVNIEGYRVRLSCDCSVPDTCEVDLDQERRLFPGLLLVRNLDSFWGAYTGSLDIVGKNGVRVRVSITYRSSPEFGKSIDQLYHLKRFVYF